MNLPTVIVKDESYINLLEEIRATETESSYNARISTILGYYQIGTLIRDYQERHNVGVTQFIRELHLDLKYAERSLWTAREMAIRWKTEDELMSQLPDGKATSWKKVKTLLNGGTDKTDDTIDLSKVAKGLVSRYGLEVAKEVAQIVLNTEE